MYSIYLHQNKNEMINILTNGYWWRCLQLKKS